MNENNSDKPRWHDLVHPSWITHLEPVSDTITTMGQFLRSEIAQGHNYVPPGNAIFTAFSRDINQVKVLLVGQDPYPTPGHAMGLSFSVNPLVNPIPKSLINIYKEYGDDLGLEPPRNGDLRPWFEQGVLLLNRCLTTRAGQPGAHQGKGWEAVTDQAIKAVVQREAPLVVILWGKQAGDVKPLLRDHGAGVSGQGVGVSSGREVGVSSGREVGVIESAHPSPLSAYRGFFGSKPFSRANAYLKAAGVAPVDWKLD